MAMNLGNLSILHPDYILPIALKKLQGLFVGKYFFPDAPVSKPEFVWRYYGKIGAMTPEVAENDIGPLDATEYEERVGRTRFYKERGMVSDFTSVIDTRNIVRDVTEHLTEKFALRVEALRIGAIVNNAFSTTVGATAKSYFYIDCDDDNSNWKGGTGAVDPVNQILDAQERITTYAKVQLDTAIASPEAIAALKKIIPLKEWQRSGPLSVEILRDGKLFNPTVPGSVGRLAGIEFFEVNASVLASQANPSGALTKLLDKDVYMFKRGSDLARMFVFRGLGVRTKKDLFADATQLQVHGAMYPYVLRPQFIYTIKNAVA